MLDNIPERLLLRKKQFLAKTKGLILIVGDRPGPSAPENEDFIHVPFYSMKYCSGWLNKKLDELSIPEEKLMWINSCYMNDGAPQSKEVFDELEPSFVIALGGNADKWLRTVCGIDYHIKIHHPQYWKRFKNKEPYPLFDLLKNLT